MKTAKTTTETGATLGTYVTGFVLSIALTLASYVLVEAHVNSSHALLSRAVVIGTVAVFAITQFIVQMLCFLHLGLEARPRWKLLIFWMMLGVVLILIFGSIWIMNNLNYRMLASPAQVNNYLQSQGDL